jgi:DNA-binding response OmpR family regulator
MVLSAKHLPLAGRPILVVENDPVIALAIADCLQDAGALVLSASNTNDALPIVENSHISAAVLDLDLGGGDSTLVCRRLSDRSIPFLFYSGYDDAYVSDKWPNATVVSKPASEQVLIMTLFGLIRHSLATSTNP